MFQSKTYTLDVTSNMTINEVFTQLQEKNIQGFPHLETIYLVSHSKILQQNNHVSDYPFIRKHTTIECRIRMSTNSNQEFRAAKETASTPDLLVVPGTFRREYFDQTEIMREACSQNWTVLQFASARLRSDPDFLLEVAAFANQQQSAHGWQAHQGPIIYSQVYPGQEDQELLSNVESVGKYSSNNCPDTDYLMYIKGMIRQNPMAFCSLASDTQCCNDVVEAALMSSETTVRVVRTPPQCPEHAQVMKLQCSNEIKDYDTSFSSLQCKLCTKAIISSSKTYCKFVQKYVSQTYWKEHYRCCAVDDDDDDDDNDDDDAPESRCEYSICTECNKGGAISSIAPPLFDDLKVVSHVLSSAVHAYHQLKRDTMESPCTTVSDAECFPFTQPEFAVSMSVVRKVLILSKNTFHRWGNSILQKTVMDFRSEIGNPDVGIKFDAMFYTRKKKVLNCKVYGKAFEYVSDDFYMDHPESMVQLHLELHSNICSHFGAAQQWWNAASSSCWKKKSFCYGLLLALQSTEYQMLWDVLQRVDMSVLLDATFQAAVKTSKIVDNETLLSTCLLMISFTNNVSMKKSIVQRSIALASDSCPYLSDPIAMYDWHNAFCPAVNYASLTLQGNKQFMTQMLPSSHGGFDFKSATKELRSDVEFVISGINQFGGIVLSDLPSEMLTNCALWCHVLKRTSWKTPVTIPSWTFAKASSTIKSDLHCVKAAVQKSATNMLYASRSLLINNKTLVADAVKREPSLIYPSLSNKFQNDHEIALIVARHDPEALHILSPLMKEQRSIVAVALQIKVPMASKLAFLYGCCIDRRNRSYSMWTISNTGALNVHITEENRYVLTSLVRDAKKQRGREMLCGLGNLGRGVLEKIFQFAAWKPHRSLRLLLNVDIHIAKEWCDDYDSLFFADDDDDDDDDDGENDDGENDDGEDDDY